MPVEKDVLTTGEVAKLCNVAPRTVSKWFDSGVLKGYRIPGSKDRRIPINELMKFMRAHGIPMDGMQTGSSRVLIVDDDREIVDTLRNVLGEKTTYDIQTALTGFAAGMACESFRPHVVLLDVHLGEADVSDFAQTLRANENLQMTKVIAMSGKLTDGQAQSLRAKGFDGFLKKPFQIRHVVDAIEAATDITR